MFFNAVYARALPTLALLRWALVVVPMSAVVGSFCALFLWGLDQATKLRFENPALLFGLPVAGLVVGLVYHSYGRAAEGGNNLIVEQIHEPGAGVPLRMAPLILISTIVTHLFGGSAGREGTAVQLGGSLAGAVGKWLCMEPSETRILLMAGIAAGFGAVFGTPIAGAVFALEVLTIGRIQYEALLPCLLSAVAGDVACRLWGIEHGHYLVAFRDLSHAPHLDVALFAKVLVAGIAFGLVGRFFSEIQHALQAILKSVAPYAPARPFLGGVCIIGLVYLFGNDHYLGLGVWSPNPADPTIGSFFDVGRSDHWSWLWKLVFTVVTLASGFKGGEVTPLFYIGAALGHSIGQALGAPVDLFAGVGFVAVFAGAANTPLACTVMGVELFGADNIVYIAGACFTAYLFSGHSSIYLSQRVGVPKGERGAIPLDISLRDARRLAQSPSPGILNFADRLQNRKRAIVLPQANSNKGLGMFSGAVTASEIGMVRIYLKPSEKMPRKTARAFWPMKPLYRELVVAAKSAGLVNAVAHHTHYGFSNHQRIEAESVEIANPDLTMCVELIGERGQLESFCGARAALLAGKVIIYKSLEYWTLEPEQRKANTARSSSRDVKLPAA